MTRPVQGYAEAHARRPAKARKRIRARRVTRGGRNSGPAKLAWLRSLRCLVFRFALDSMDCRGPSEVHHVRLLGSRADDRKTVVLCDAHHMHGPRAVGVIGRRAFEHHYRVDLMTEAKRYETEWRVRKESGAAS